VQVTKQAVLYCIGGTASPLAILVRSTKHLQTGLLGFVKLVSDSTNRLHETVKSETGETGLKPV